MIASYELPHLDVLESEAIHVMREVAAEFERPVLLFSGGKDSVVLLRIAEKAFRPGRFPFPLLQVATGHEFPEVTDFIRRRVDDLGERLIVASGAGLDRPRPRRRGVRAEPVAQPPADRDPARRADRGPLRCRVRRRARDEERARAKERILSFRDDLGQWDPKNQRPELWNLYNGRIKRGEHVRVFPISNWTELDVWEYIARERLELPSIYFAHEREVFRRDGMLYAASDFVSADETFTTSVRYRTVGDMVVTGAVESVATSLEDVVAEIAATRITERGETRADDRVTEAAMEDRKREGYF
jgi:sulfate adenylyltransferase subunit 2